MQVTFEHLTGSKQGQLEQMDGERITVGRNPTSKLQFDPHKDMDVSGDHAQLAVGDDGKFHLTDLGSRNGTLLNGAPVSGAAPLAVEPGSKIQFGKNGPTVKIHYTPGPSKSQVQLSQLQSQMEADKAAAAQQKKKTTMIAAIVAGVLVVGGTVGFVVSSKKAKRRNAETAQTAAAEMAQKASKKQAKQYATALFLQAEQADMAGKKAAEEGDYVLAAAKFDEAKKKYDEAIDAAEEAKNKALQAKLDEEAQKRAEEAARREEAMLEQQRAFESQLAQAEAANKAQLAKLQADAAKASAAERARLEEEIAKLSTKPDSAKAREIIAASDPSICYIKVESYVQPAGTKARAVIHRAEGTGYVIAADTIVAAKHILQPWKYDAKVLATAKKIKEEQGLDVQDYVEVYMSAKPGDPFVAKAKFDSASGTCKISKVAPDKRVAQAQTVTINWNEAPTEVAGIQTHEKNVEDFGLIAVPAGGLKPLALGDHPAQKFDGVLILGTVQDAGGKKEIKLSPAKAEVQTADKETFSLACTVPATFSGAPVFKYDGKVYGIAASTEGNNLICLPIEKVIALTKGAAAAPAEEKPEAPEGE